ncbi:MAG: acyl-CoA thioesterase [Acidobacteriia bacterium]|nr:acyl-CoA thioesterase [Terriglobia bacterium]
MTPPGGREYRAEVLVRFAHCDPAGMVFYPRYLEMFNNLVEDWCREAHLPFAELLSGRGWSLPTVHLDVDFLAPSLMGETLSATLRVRSLGASSITLEIVLEGPDGAARVRGGVVLVLMDLRSRSAVEIPDDLRQRIAAFLE